MTEISSLDWNEKLSPQKSKLCKSCGLFLNQLPSFDNAKTSHIFWVGLSAVKFDEYMEKIPLSHNTKSGGLIGEIEAPLKSNLSFYRTNLVKCLPLKGDKIRYPIKREMERCYPNLDYEISILKPKIIFLLGKLVSSYVLKKHDISDVNFDDNFNYKSFEFDGIKYVPIHHPSYILVYKRKYIHQYMNGIRNICTSNLSNYQQRELETVL